MYVGAGLALVGAALFFQAPMLGGYAALFFLAAHAFVVRYEEPTLRKAFGQEYEVYCARTGRWWPRT
jgi:protein-S-isoprenylcysteine O-methyltransferase Ste14